MGPCITTSCFQCDTAEDGGSVDKRDQEGGIGQELILPEFQQTIHQTLTGMLIMGEASLPACTTVLVDHWGVETMAGTRIHMTHVQKICFIYAKRISG